MPGYSQKKARKCPSKKKSSRHKWRFKRCRGKDAVQDAASENNNERMETEENGIISGNDDKEDRQASECASPMETELLNPCCAQQSCTTHEADFEANVVGNSSKKFFPSKRRSKRFKYRQKRFANHLQTQSSNVTVATGNVSGVADSRGRLSKNTSEKSNATNGNNNNDEISGIPVEVQCSEQCSKNIEKCCSVNTSCHTKTSGLCSKKNENHPIILDKIKKEPVKLLLDVPCSNEADVKINSYVKEKMERYVIDAVHFYEEIIQKYYGHKKVESTCRIEHWKLKPEKTVHHGLIAKFTIECQNCLDKDHVFSESYKEHVMDVNTAVIAGTLSTGIGHTQLEQILGSMGVHCMSDKTYIDRQSNVCQDIFHNATEKSMHEAAEEEKRLAIENGDITEEGIPFITVIIDGSWLRRTYGTHWNSCSGTAVIIGARTKKVLFFGIRNKYCLLCARAINAGKEAKIHLCEKNWASDQPSTAMESNIILQGFVDSVPKHGLIYKTVVMDNDSNLFNTIVKSKVYREYKVTPQRILCSVHLFKNTCKNLRKAADSTQTVNKGQRGIGVVRCLIKKNINSMRLRLKEVVSKRIKQKGDWNVRVEMLRKDVIKIPNEIFGNCKVTVKQDCKKIVQNQNVIPLIQSFGLFDKIEKVFKQLSIHSDSLLHNQSTNAAELLNALICRALGGKRINWGLKSQYKTRVTTQILQFNTGKCLSEFYKEKNKIVPHILTKVEGKRLAKVRATRNRRLRYGVVKGGRKRPTFEAKSAKKYYGKSHEDVDMSSNDFEREKNLRLQDLKRNQTNRVKIQRHTVGKNQSHEWLSMREKLLFADNFYLACSWKSSTSCASRVKKILYPVSLKDEVQKYIEDQENLVKDNLAEKFKYKVLACGVFIDEDCEFLGASPTALIGRDGILQVVCPFDVADMSVAEAVKKSPSLKRLFKKDSLEILNEKSNIFYEVQGALHIMKKKFCYLVVKTRIDEKILRVDVNKNFYRLQMKNQLKNFFENCLLPEMIDSRRDRGMEIRNPPETCEILEMKQKRKEEKKETMQVKNNKKRKLEVLCNTEAKDEVDADCQYVGSYKIKRRRDEMSKEWFRDFANNRVISYHHIRRILTTPDMLLDDDVLDRLVRIMNDVDNPIFDIQSVLYVEQVESVEAVSKPVIQIIGGNYIKHWRTIFFDWNIKKVHVYDSLPSHTNFKLKPIEREYLSARLGFQVKSRDVTFRKMKVEQRDGSSCGLYAAAFAVSLYMGEEPSEIYYSTRAMELRRHLLKIIYTHNLTSFPTMHVRAN